MPWHGSVEACNTDVNQMCEARRLTSRSLMAATGKAARRGSAQAERCVRLRAKLTSVSVSETVTGINNAERRPSNLQAHEARFKAHGCKLPSKTGSHASTRARALQCHTHDLNDYDEKQTVLLWHRCTSGFAMYDVVSSSCRNGCAQWCSQLNSLALAGCSSWQSLQIHADVRQCSYPLRRDACEPA